MLQLELEGEREFSLNKTNIRVLIGAHGRKTADWIGKSIILYVDPNVMFSGRLVGGVRVQIPPASDTQMRPGRGKTLDSRDQGGTNRGGLGDGLPGGRSCSAPSKR